MRDDNVESPSLGGDQNSSVSTSMDINAIIQLLPHRYPFLLIDRVLSHTDDSLIAIKNISINEPFFEGHFPGHPVMPGVLMLEAMAQAAGVLAYKTTGITPQDALFLLAGIDKVRYRHMVVPGDQLRLEVRFLGRKQHFWKIAGVATVDGKEACSAEMMCARQDLV